MLPVSKMAGLSAEVATRLLAGEPARDIAVPPTGAGSPAFDGRELVRFGLSTAHLPPGSRVMFQEPNAWDRYRWLILGALALCLVQTTFIAGLAASRRRHRRSETALTASEARLREAVGEARDFAGRLIRAQEDERSRLGRELHDDITQRLAVLAIDVGRCERQAAAPADATLLARVREQLARLSSDVHALSYQLHPSILADLGLVEALEAEAERVRRIEGLPVELVTENVPDPMPRPVALCLYRVTQEALRNITRHAGARRARVTLRCEAGSIRLVVDDDGSGFDPDAVRRRPSLGLASMRQRVAAVGGSVRIDTGAGRGTCVEVVLPLGETGDDAAAAAAC
jgi:signal transduction histidine kinase